MARYVFYGGGAKLSTGDRRWQSFAQVLVGGMHMFPQTALGNRGFAAEVGAGVSRRLQQGWWLRFEGDYVRSQLYAAGQNNFQAAITVNYRF